MKVFVTGTAWGQVSDQVINEALKNSGFKPTQIIGAGEHMGAEGAIKDWADRNQFPFEEWPKIPIGTKEQRTNIRNAAIDEAEAVIAVVQGDEDPTKYDAYSRKHDQGKPVYVERI